MWDAWDLFLWTTLGALVLWVGGFCLCELAWRGLARWRRWREDRREMAALHRHMQRMYGLRR